MRLFFKILLASFVALVLFFGGLTCVTTGVVSVLASSKKDKKEIKNNSVLVIDLTKSIRTQPAMNPLGILNAGNGVKEMSLLSTLRKIEKAKRDDKIKAIYLKMGACPSGWVYCKEIRTILQEFKDKGKKIVAYGDMFDTKSYYIATVADKIIMQPQGLLLLKGLSANIQYFKRLLDKYDVQTEIFYAGKYKSATEPYRLDRISAENRHQMNTLFDDI